MQSCGADVAAVVTRIVSDMTLLHLFAASWLTSGWAGIFIQPQMFEFALWGALGRLLGGRLGGWNYPNTIFAQPHRGWLPSSFVKVFGWDRLAFYKWFFQATRCQPRPCLAFYVFFIVDCGAGLTFVSVTTGFVWIVTVS
jgi:hypothetical protein